MDRARNGCHARPTALLLLLLGASWTLPGCISGGAAGRDGALAGPRWGRSNAEPGYDHYAQNMPQSAGRTNRDPVLAAAAGPAKAKRPEATPAPEVAAEPRPRSRADEEVRVTLGRPESLRVLKDGGDAAGPALASAALARPSIAPAPALEPAPTPTPTPTRPRNPEPADPIADRLEPAAAPSPAVVDRAEPPRGGEATEDSDATLRRLLTDARTRLEAMATYQVDITRVERVGSQLQPEEEAVLSIQRKPKAVRLEWPDGPNKGREVIYSAAVNERTMYINSANSAIPIPRMSLPVDSPLALRNSRHAITEAGFDTIFDNLFHQLGDADHAPPPGGRLTYKGLQKPDGVDQTCHLIQRITPSKEIWRVFLDTETLMPVVVTAQLADGELLERYKYENLRPNPESLASADAFDPDKRWGESKGFLSRLATAAGAAAAGTTNPPAAEQSTTR